MRSQLGRDRRNPFFHTLGAGVELTYPLTQALLLRPAYEHRVKNYSDAGDRPTSRELTGADDILTLTASLRSAAIRFSPFRSPGSTKTRGSPSTPTAKYGGTVSYQIAYAAPFGMLDAPWTTSAVVAES